MLSSSMRVLNFIGKASLELLIFVLLVVILVSNLLIQN